MPSLFIKHPTLSVQEKKKIESDIYWYDALRKRLYKFKGTKLNVVYRNEQDEETENPDRPTPIKRWLPELVNEEIIVLNRVSDPQKTEKWINQRKLDSISISNELENQDKEGITIEIKKEEFDDIIDDLERDNFEFEIL